MSDEVVSESFGTRERFGFAGFWRRSSAFLIDGLIIGTGFGLVAALLFSMTGGYIQSSGSFSVNLTICQSAFMTPDPGSTDPMPDVDKWQLCHGSFLGLPISRILIGIKEATEGSGETRFTYPVRSDQTHLDFRPEVADTAIVLDFSLVELLALAAYLFAMERNNGQSYGKWIVRIVVRDASDLNRVRLPNNKAIQRQAAKLAGLLPLAVFQTALSLVGISVVLAAILQAHFTILFIISVALTLWGLGWYIWIGSSIARRSDPVHDRFADTTVRLLMAPN